jgi:hypothetical protein
LGTYFFRNVNEEKKTLIYIKMSGKKEYALEKRKFFLIGPVLVNFEPDYEK